jgi:hypothetical protein
MSEVALALPADAAQGKQAEPDDEHNRSNGDDCSEHAGSLARHTVGLRMCECVKLLAGRQGFTELSDDPRARYRRASPSHSAAHPNLPIWLWVSHTARSRLLPRIAHGRPDLQ